MLPADQPEQFLVTSGQLAQRVQEPRALGHALCDIRHQAAPRAAMGKLDRQTLAPGTARSVRVDCAELDPVIYHTVRAWLERDWPFHSIEYAPRV
jgi:hypothetical protein